MMSRLHALPVGLRIVATALILTLALGWMVYNRVETLRTGKEIILKTVPIDPRDLFRGHYVRLNYEVSRIDTDKVAAKDSFKRKDRIYVILSPQQDGFWTPTAVHKSPQPNGGVMIAGRIRRVHNATHTLTAEAQKTIVEIQTRIATANKTYSIALNRRRAELRKAGADSKTIREKTADLRNERQTARHRLFSEMRKVRKQGRKECDGICQQLTVRYGIEKYFLPKKKALDMEKQRNNRRLAVIARVASDGIAAISGLMIDGKKIYDETLF